MPCPPLTARIIAQVARIWWLLPGLEDAIAAHRAAESRAKQEAAARRAAEARVTELEALLRGKHG